MTEEATLDTTSTSTPDAGGSSHEPQAPASDRPSGEPRVIGGAKSTQQQQGDDGAGSPPADGNGEQGEPQESSFEALQKVYAKQRERREANEKAALQADAGQRSGDQPNPEASNTGDDQDDNSDLLGKIPQAEWESMKGKTRKRIVALRARMNQLNQYFAANKTKVDAHDQFSRYLRDNNLTVDEANYAIDLMAAINSDPERAARALAPLNDFIAGQIGDRLPPDIEARVQSGEISAQAGKELAANRAANERAQRQQADAQAEQQARQAQTQRAAQWQQGTQALVGAISNWEAQWKGSDPDYEAKKPLVAQRLKRVLAAKAQGGIMVTPAEGLKLAKEIRAEVEYDFKRNQPAPRTQRVPQGGSVRQARPQPKSTFDAVTQAYERMKGRRVSAAS